MKINSRNLILMALVGMSSVHLMAMKGKANTSSNAPKSYSERLTEAGTAVGTAANKAYTTTSNAIKATSSAVFNAPKEVAKAMGHSTGQIISGPNGSLASAIGYRTTNNPQGKWTLGETAAAQGLQSAGRTVANTAQTAASTVAKAVGYNSKAQPSSSNMSQGVNGQQGWNFTTAGTAVYRAPGKALGGKFGLNAEGQIISGPNGSLRSATAAVGDKLINLTMPEGISQKTTLTNDGRVVDYTILPESAISKSFNEKTPLVLRGTLNGNQSALAAAGRAAYRTPGRLAMKLGLSKDGKIISGKDGSVMSAATAAKTAITNTLRSIGATMTPTPGQKSAIAKVYRDAVASIRSTASWTAGKLDAFTNSVSSQVSRIFETKEQQSARINKETLNSELNDMTNAAELFHELYSERNTLRNNSERIESAKKELNWDSMSSRSESPLSRSNSGSSTASLSQAPSSISSSGSSSSNRLEGALSPSTKGAANLATAKTPVETNASFFGAFGL